MSQRDRNRAMPIGHVLRDVTSICNDIVISRGIRSRSGGPSAGSNNFLVKIKYVFVTYIFERIHRLSVFGNTDNSFLIKLNMSK